MFVFTALSLDATLQFLFPPHCTFFLVFWCSCPCFEVQQSFPVRLSTGSTVQAQVSQHPLLCHCFWSLLLQLFFPTFCYQLSLIDYYTYVRALLVLSQGSYTCNSLLTSSHQMQPYVNVLIYAKIAAEHHSSVASAEKHLKHGFAGGHVSSSKLPTNTFQYPAPNMHNLVHLLQAVSSSRL